MDHSERMELLSRFVGIVEDWLEDKGITIDDIKSEDRDLAIFDGENPNMLPIIYGEDYDFLTSQFEQQLIVFELLEPEERRIYGG